MSKLPPISETKPNNGGGISQPSAPLPKLPTTSTGNQSQQPSSSKDRTFGIPPPPSGLPPSRDRTFVPRKNPPEYNNRRNPRRRQKTSSSSSSGCCRCFLWSTLILFILVLLFAASIGMFFAIYHPKDTKFSVTDIRLSKFELSPNDQLLSSLTLNISTRNPSESKFHYIYGKVSVSIFSSDDIFIGNGHLPAYDHAGGKTLTLSAKIKNDGKVLDAAKAESFRKTAILNTVIHMDTKAGLKADSLKINYVKIRVVCKDVMLPTRRKLPATVIPIEAKCETKIKFWKWYL
ncbi:hypothetical protein ZOSMA_163G00210 [Zostera marina]|uniref:Late embryogenesis abundant protein LEA-2 subgroup domain-containing protein n=1 Tax=Zostera marina TaxID=29655 RepID=A0A0K9PU21_ZOSMR|nr:hypothetical protein ZOSMA_163G00210 [Zostera marina]